MIGSYSGDPGIACVPSISALVGNHPSREAGLHNLKEPGGSTTESVDSFWK